MQETETAQLTKISSFLDSTSSRLIEELKTVLAGDFGLYKNHTVSNVDLFDFEVSADGYAVSLYPMDAESTQLGYKQILAEYPNGFLRDTDLDLDTDSYDFDSDADMDRMDEFYDKLQKTFTNWFSDCWQAAGGLETDRKFYLAMHDSDRSLDLKTRKWISNKNK